MNHKQLINIKTTHKMKQLQICIILLFAIIHQLSYSQLTFDSTKYLEVKTPFNQNLFNNNYLIYEDTILTITDEEYIIFIYNIDTVKLNKEFKEYSALFNSGLISPNVFGYSEENVSFIKEITELETNLENGRNKVFKLHIIHNKFLNPFEAYIEIRNERPSDSKNINEFILGSKVTFSCLTVLL